MMKKRLMIALCCLVLLVQLLPIVPFADAVDLGMPVQESDIYYCREQLKTLENSEALLFAYDNLVAGINDCAEEIEISNDQYQLSPDEFGIVLESTRRDHTEQFWMGTNYTPITNYEGTIVYSVRPTYLMVGDELQDAQAAFNQAIDLMLARLTPNMSEYEMEKALHDMLATQVTYISTPNAHNAYGALVEGKAVCEGYAEALQCLLQRVGIQSVEMFGASRGENHAWNLVRIEGQYYLVDLTWNDQGNILLYAYFNQTSAIFAEDHEPWPIGRTVNVQNLEGIFGFPTCTAIEENYFTKEGLRIKTYTVESIGKLLKENNLSVALFIESDPKAFVEWYNNNYDDLAVAAGISGGYSWGKLDAGHEVLIYFETCKHENMSVVEAKAPTCDVDGNTQHRACSDCHKIFLMEDDANGFPIEIMNRDSVKVFSIGHDWSVRNTADEATLKHTATNCQEYDTYWYICAICNKTSDSYTFTTDAGDHIDADGNGVCDLCNDGESPFGFEDILEIITSPVFLGGGGGAIVLFIIIAVIRRIREF